MVNIKSVSALVFAGALAAAVSMPAFAGNNGQYYSNGQIAAGVLGAVLVGTAIANSNNNNYAPAPTYYAPQPSYYSQPQPTYYAPQQSYYSQPQPVYYDAPQTYYAPAPVYYAPPVTYVAPRAVVYVNGGYGYNGYRGHPHRYYGYR